MSKVRERRPRSRPAPRTRAVRRRRRRRSLPKPVGIAIVSVIALALLGAVALLAFRVVRAGSLPNIELASRDVGALGDAELRDAIEAIETEIRADRLVLTRPANDTSEEESIETTGADLDYQVDVDATSERILLRGRQGNPIAALVDQVRSTFTTIEVEPVDSLASEDAVRRAARRLSSPPFYGGVRFEDGVVEPRYPEPGVVVTGSQLRDRVLGAVLALDVDEIAVRGRSIDPPTDRADVDALVADAERAVDGPVVLTRAGRSLTFSPSELGSLIGTDRSGTGDDIELSLAISPRALTEFVGDRIDAFETPPQDATFELTGTTVSVVPDRPGFRFVPAVTARQMFQLALREGPARAAFKGQEAKAEFTTADARALDIDEQVSTFTTYHSCCEPRVENIHRIAEIVDGAVVQPGESFSLNDFVGPRTTSNGFVPAPAISNGEFVEEVGGGISQFATTTFNAIFFGGYDFLEYQPHSYYISRYPPGREATISTPAPDLEFLNDSDAGVYIDTSYTETSITVSFYGSVGFEVEAIEGPRRNVTPPKEECRENESLARGEESVVQEGITGFDIVVTRVFSNGRDDETFSTHYNTQPRIVERRKCPKKKN